MVTWLAHSHRAQRETDACVAETREQIVSAALRTTGRKHADDFGRLRRPTAQASHL